MQLLSSGEAQIRKFYKPELTNWAKFLIINMYQGKPLAHTHNIK